MKKPTRPSVTMPAKSAVAGRRTSGQASDGTEPNTNCLEGQRCPKCGSWGPFEVLVSVRVLLFDNGAHDAEDGSIEYDGHSPARCQACGHRGKFRAFDAQRGRRR